MAKDERSNVETPWERLARLTNEAYEKGETPKRSSDRHIRDTNSDGTSQSRELKVTHRSDEGGGKKSKEPETKKKKQWSTTRRVAEDVSLLAMTTSAALLGSLYVGTEVTHEEERALLENEATKPADLLNFYASNAWLIDEEDVPRLIEALRAVDDRRLVLNVFRGLLWSAYVAPSEEAKIHRLIEQLGEEVHLSASEILFLHRSAVHQQGRREDLEYELFSSDQNQDPGLRYQERVFEILRHREVLGSI